MSSWVYPHHRTSSHQSIDREPDVTSPAGRRSRCDPSNAGQPFRGQGHRRRCQPPVTIRSSFSTDCSSMETGTTGQVTPVRIPSSASDQSQ